MRKIWIIYLFLFSLNSLSQEYNNFSPICNFDNGYLKVFCQNIKDSIYVNISLSNKISEKFVQSEYLRISYKNNKDSSFTEPYDINLAEKELLKNIEYNLYKLFEYCILEYEKYFFEKNKEQIMRLSSKNISYYYYKVHLIIVPIKY